MTSLAGVPAGPFRVDGVSSYYRGGRVGVRHWRGYVRYEALPTVWQCCFSTDHRSEATARACAEKLARRKNRRLSGG